MLSDILEIVVPPVSAGKHARGFNLMLISLLCGFQFIISNTVEVNRNVPTTVHAKAQWQREQINILNSLSGKKIYRSCRHSKILTNRLVQ